MNNLFSHIRSHCTPMNLFPANGSWLAIHHPSNVVFQNRQVWDEMGGGEKTMAGLHLFGRLKNGASSLNAVKAILERHERELTRSLVSVKLYHHDGIVHFSLTALPERQHILEAFGSDWRASVCK